MSGASQKKEEEKNTKTVLSIQRKILGIHVKSFYRLLCRLCSDIFDYQIIVLSQ